MNPKVLTKLYDQLTARQRLALLIAASDRADPVERQRLMDSVPSEHFAAPHHFNLATALTEAATIHLLTLLDVAASYWQWWGLWGWHELRSKRQTVPDQAAARGMDDHEVEEEKLFRLISMVRYQAFLFVTHREGWRQFCREWPLEPEALLKIKPGWDLVLRTEGPAREHAYSPEEAALFLLSETPLPDESADEDVELPQVVTVAGLAQVWHTNGAQISASRNPEAT